MRTVAAILLLVIAGAFVAESADIKCTGYFHISCYTAKAGNAKRALFQMCKVKPEIVFEGKMYGCPYSIIYTFSDKKTHDTYQTCEHDQKYYQKTVQPYKISSVKPKGLAGDGVCEGQKF
eukprot:jgi/Chrzof1/832/Cz01g30160.t1